MKALNFEDDIRPLASSFFDNHYVIVFDKTSMQNATEFCHHHELFRGPLRLEIKFIFLVEHLTDCMGEKLFLIAVVRFGVFAWSI